MVDSDEQIPTILPPSDGDEAGGIILPDRALVSQALPETLFALPLGGLVLFPRSVAPIRIPAQGRGQATLDQIRLQGHELLAVLTQRPGTGRDDAPTVAGEEGPEVEPGDLFEIGCLARILRTGQLPDGSLGLLVSGIHRLRVRRYRRVSPVFIVEVDYPDEVVRDSRQVEALERTARRTFAELVPLHPGIPEQVVAAAGQVEGAAAFADFCAASLPMEVEKRQGFLSTFEIDARLRALVEHLLREIDLARLSAKVREELQERVQTQQRQIYLREQLQAIRRELGEEVDAKTEEIERFRRLIEERGLSDEATKQATEELSRMELLPAEAAEYHVIRTYVDWLVEVPWAQRSEETLDLDHARKILETDHYGLEEVKSRFLEFLAVRKLKGGHSGAILCLAGPPGVGKTSLGQSIARATGRQFHRISLGGMRDEAEIKGHRRTYVGAMPGKILQGLRRVGARNPVFMLDEIDKLASDWRGDPSSALLEVLDPAQNHAFADHYLDVPFDLTEVMFIATANYVENIPPPLRDRMELIEIPGYVPDEKRQIARRYLLGRQMRAHGIGPKHLAVRMKAIDTVIAGYTREAGVRELERQLGRIARKVATRVAAAPDDAPPPRVVVDPAAVATYLGPPRYRAESEARVDRPGVVVGLAWTPVGGETLFVEAVAMPGRGELRLTGRLGQVMAESAHIARSLVRVHAGELGIDEKVFREKDLHLHVPAGAVPKDGPSAGIALATALVSLLTGKKVRSHLAMTGELTLRGSVTAIGGLREKLVGAKRAGIKTVVVPAENRPDLEEVPERVRRGMKIVFAEELDDVLRAAGLSRRGSGRRRR